MKNNPNAKLFSVKQMVFCALCMALCIVLPMAFHAIPNAGSVYSPIHIPVLLCGLICGPVLGAVCGAGGVLLSSLITGMPPMAMLPPMLVECVTYGLLCGLGMRLVRTGKTTADLYISLAAAMIGGRIVSGIAKAFVFTPGAMSVQLWISGYFVTSLPGIILHLLLIPAVVLALYRARLLPARYGA
ncbi:MAG: ECF transporter S component [Clostridia bacterium]|nr:ECF transporter S component [Clostridia bacterium]